ncbi:hypothetical protein IW136_002684 [Coemansia sp. RSA 678]|nr:hypothetical protein IW136_002684 [Coemansia sp. RSA 678]
MPITNTTPALSELTDADISEVAELNNASANGRKLDLYIDHFVSVVRQNSELNAKNLGLVTMLRGQELQRESSDEQLWKRFDWLVPKLEDNPRAVENWIRSARVAIKGMDDKEALAGLCCKLVGPMVHQCGCTQFQTCEDLFKILLDVLSPEFAREGLFIDIKHKRRYREFSPNDGIFNAILDMAFLRVGGDSYKYAERFVVDALLDIFPKDIPHNIRMATSLYEICELLRVFIGSVSHFPDYDGWAERVPTTHVAAVKSTKLHLNAAKPTNRRRNNRKNTNKDSGAGVVIISGSPSDLW